VFIFITVCCVKPNLVQSSHENIVMITLFWDSSNLIASNHIRSWSQLDSVHYYFTVYHCTVLFLHLAQNSLVILHIHYSPFPLTHVNTSCPHSLRLNSRFYSPCLDIRVLCMLYFKNRWVITLMGWFSTLIEGMGKRKRDWDFRSFESQSVHWPSYAAPSHSLFRITTI
jgi:hypothetical protein